MRDGTHGAAIAILYGIGGVGKTAIAKTVYNQNFHKFKGRSLQRQLLSDILNKTADETHDVDEGIIKIKDALCCKELLLFSMTWTNGTSSMQLLACKMLLPNF